MMSVINNKYTNLANKKEEFLHALPYPHIVLDDFLDESFFSNLKNVFDSIGDPRKGRNFDTDAEEKKWISLNSSLPDAIKQVVDSLNTDVWVENMRALTGIPTLLSTPNGNTELANYHVMAPGGVLGPHVDHSYEPRMGIPHVLNILIYLTDNWEEGAGGGTLFYDEKGKNIISKVAYKRNRAVIFLHTPYSFHGVERIDNNAKLKRRTIYVDYYSESFHPYDGMKLNFDVNWFKHGTTFKLSSNSDYFKFRNRQYAKLLLRYQLSRIARKLPGFWVHKINKLLNR